MVSQCRQPYNLMHSALRPDNPSIRAAGPVGTGSAGADGLGGTGGIAGGTGGMGGGYGQPSDASQQGYGGPVHGSGGQSGPGY